MSTNYFDNNEILDDATLSWKAKGLYAYLLSLGGDLNIRQQDLVDASVDGSDSLRTAIQELEKHGYLRRERVRTHGQLKK